VSTSPLSRFALRFIETYQQRTRQRLRVACPFEPTCSEYGRLAFERYGAITATRKTLGRLRRCRPGYTGPLVDPP
jgi:putative component of membrane protein insertase Oxa1/YidC/SpoIIIJ protein YidD